MLDMEGNRYRMINGITGEVGFLCCGSSENSEKNWMQWIFYKDSFHTPICSLLRYPSFYFQFLITKVLLTYVIPLDFSDPFVSL